MPVGVFSFVLKLPYSRFTECTKQSISLLMDLQRRVIPRIINGTIRSVDDDATLYFASKQTEGFLCKYTCTTYIFIIFESINRKLYIVFLVVFRTIKLDKDSQPVG